MRRLLLRRAKRRPRDAGLQGERTALAWIRTGLAVFVNALVALRSGWINAQPWIVVVGIALLAAAAGAALYGGWRRHHLLNVHRVIAAPPTAVAVAAVVCQLACIAAIASVLVR